MNDRRRFSIPLAAITAVVDAAFWLALIALAVSPWGWA